MALTQAIFNALVEDHSAPLYRMAYRLVGDRHEAEDLVQEAFRSAWKSRLRYESGRGDRAWLASILRRRAIDRLRRRRVRLVYTGDSPAEVAIAGEDPLAGEYPDEIQAALDELPDKLRHALLLVVVGDLTHQEVADMLEIPLGTVLSRVNRARQRLRKSLLAAAKN